ncbi:MAG TPA: hypothetical protein PK509_11750, partial [Catalimonadaceae bacterium]|nr:hypothetical protein [Catalimonadaceae bacterium]
SKPNQLHLQMRVYHRYLGFFLAGIMAVYATSGVILIFRNTDFLKNSIHKVEQLKPGMDEKAVGEAIDVRNLKFDSTSGAVQFFKLGTYHSETGVADYTLKKYPFVVKKLTDLHKANTKDPLFYLNIFFGASLLFFVLSAFWMYMPGTTVFRKGLLFTAAGILLVVLMLMV